MTRTRTLRRAAGALLVLAACASALPARAQVGTVSPLPYPGWLPSDRVIPSVAVQVDFDHAAGLWRYRYTVANAAGAEQAIQSVGFQLGGWAAGTYTPAGWSAIGDTEATFSPTGPGIPGTEFLADLPDTEFSGDTLPPPAHRIVPGGSLAGFGMDSPFPPGYVRTYVQGYAAIPLPPSDGEPAADSTHPAPHDTLNSQRVWSIGPARYTRVVTRGNLNVDNAEGFLGFLNLATSGTVLRSPAPVALKFSVAGETVFPETFRALLNGVDVTARFHPGTAGGADRVALFVLGTLPLQEGTNVLVTTIEGLLPGTTRRAIDEDLIEFDVVP
ncbi:MAG TPA: hypothetical protein VGR37_03515 [Longimicrobiaceae bacterium]|nr:hypothetical protein [Longimicrobiaceae bacterium]